MYLFDPQRRWLHAMSHVPLARCSETGLLLLCLSTFQEDLPECVKHLRDPKARPRSRPLKPQGSVAQKQQSLARVLDPGTHPRSGEGTGDRPSPVAMVLLAPVPNYEGLVNGCFCSTTSVYYNRPASEWPNIIIFTGGARYQFDAQGRDRKRINHKDGWVDAFPVAVRNFNVRLHDLRELNDPREGAFSQCVGRHTGILEGVLNSQAGRYILTSCFKDIEMAVDGHKPLVVLPYCTSNRHRSVAMGTLISAGLYVLGMDHFLGHLHANKSWADMKCGGKCARCRGHFDHAEATQLGNRVLAQLDPQVTRYATHPADRQRSLGGGGTIPDPAAHSAPPPVTRGTSIGPPRTGGGPKEPTSWVRKEVPIPDLQILCQRKRRNRVCRAVHPLHRPTTLVADTECREALRYLRDRLRLRSGGSGGDGGGAPPKRPPAGRVAPPRDDQRKHYWSVCKLSFKSPRTATRPWS